MDPFYSGFISMVLRNAPYYNYNSVIREKKRIIEKEIRASLDVYHPVAFDYSPILGGSSDVYSRLAQNLPLDDVVHTEINKALHLCKGKFYR
jgi:hypothetical protein